jgi:hypothetical protein
MPPPASASDSETPSVPENPASTAVVEIDEQPVENLVATAPDVKAPIDRRETIDDPEPREPSPPITLPQETSATIGNTTAPLSTESLAEAEHPTPPPAAPVNLAPIEPATNVPSPLAARPQQEPEPVTNSILELPAETPLPKRADIAATPATTADAPLPYPTVDKIRDFIRAYCNAYQSRDINRFRLFFVEDAIEMNRPIRAALPVYQRNFDALAALDYDIDLQAWEEDEVSGQVTLKGRFDIRYRMSDSDWRQTQGDIRMDLVESRGVYRIKRLDYWKE